ncbi:MAG: energy transducer TonB [Sphingobacteriales bacterium]
MLKIVFSCPLLVFSISVFAQSTTSTIIVRDTINLRGIVYHSDGKPASPALILAKSLDLKYNKYPISAMTDSNGYFNINGIKQTDTLTISGTANGEYIKVANMGSRYMVVYLPPAEDHDLNSRSPIQISTVRKFPKPVRKFKIEKPPLIFDGYYIEQMASPPRGINRFLDYIKMRLRYPQKAIESNIEGTVEIGFTVQKDGSLSDFRILKGIGYGCDEQVINILKQAAPWKPRITLNRPAISRETVTVEFKLTNK